MKPSKKKEAKNAKTSGLVQNVQVCMDIRILMLLQKGFDHIAIRYRNEGRKFT